MIGSLRTKRLQIFWNRIRRNLFVLGFKGLEVVFQKVGMPKGKAKGYA